MVQLSPSPTLEDSSCPSAERQEELEKQEEQGPAGGLNAPQLDVSTAYHQGYETYIEDGLICLKHKIRNLEKKKLKLKDYKRRLGQGEELNRDQMVAVEKYEEVLHHLDLARELHKTLDGLTQTLLKAQKNAVKKEQMVKMEAERRRLIVVLQLQHLLRGLQQEHVQKDLLAGCKHAPRILAEKLNSMVQLAALLGISRDTKISLEEQMEQAAGVYMDLLEGKDKPVAGSTYKLLKDELLRLLNYKYFSCLPPPPTETPDLLLSSSRQIATKSESNESSKKFYRLRLSEEEASPPLNWREDFQAKREQEPPDSWDMHLQDGPLSPQSAPAKSWKGAATFIPKVHHVTSKKISAEDKPRKEKKAKAEQTSKSENEMNIPVEVFNSPSSLPKDPILRKQHLEDLLNKIHCSFSFMQDSLLDGENSVSNGTPRLKRQSSGTPPLDPLAHGGLRSPLDVLPTTMHSTPLPPRHMECKVRLTNGDQSLRTSDLDPSSVNLPHVFKVGSALPQNGDPQGNSNSAVFSGPSYNTASTQTPPEFAPPDDEPQLGYQADYAVSGQMFLSPGQSGGGPSRSNQSYSRGSVRGNARGGKGLAQSFRSSGWNRGSYTPQTHHRDPGLFYAARDSGYQHSYRRGGGRHNSSVAWSDSSQVSSPDREGMCPMVDSGVGDSMSVSTVEVPLTPHSHPPSLLPMQLYPLSHPLRVAFTASRTANFAPGNLDQPIVFDQLHTNLGEMYDSHIGRFTCPVNGTYVFIFHILKLAINVPLYVNLMRDDEVMVSAYANDGAPDHETASNHAILPLFQGDQVWLRLHRGAIYGSTWKYSTFSGFLLYQD
ncbi:transcript variant X4 [Nothobranchius furzeri]|uniref:Transcript variant X4 n=1 Tax=Nothobranchius furzeri TaxID=105023 RepID=A0A9D3C2A3_NOTFU|nr:transcript variant X4 [Nothobranchius furzeri]